MNDANNIYIYDNLYLFISIFKNNRAFKWFMVLHHQNFRIFDLSLDVYLNIYTDCRLCFLRDFIMNNFYRAVNPIKKDFLFHKPIGFASSHCPCSFRSLLLFSFSYSLYTCIYKHENSSYKKRSRKQTRYSVTSW